MTTTKVDVLKERRNLKTLLSRLFREQTNSLMRDAAKLLEESYKEFLKEAVSKGATGILGTAEVITEETVDSGGFITKISVFVPQEGGGGNRVFHVLNGGRPALGHASNYTSKSGRPLKAWPLYLPRQDPNSPMTDPGSAILHQVVSIEDVVFRPSINKPTEARNFVDEIEKRAEAKLKNSGIPNFITIKAVDV